ncbi:MAG: restriction endonuclease [Cyanobacteria bacterium]|nr:restriction endonuclease [Cyanobacteria bacterium CG_2015-16_32_12]NCO79633.1 restriction endonuclease [Cyanobacteria bacterium CG_2015-22_32_23]NCQ04318.1 restriction endonuclease [Cyanobacteria bacterium CG_2015-09_32_10]
MNTNNLVEEIKSKFKKPNAIQLKVFNLLSDKKWHCRECEGKKIASGQYAGGGGIQGLERGTKTREGLVIESKDDFCNICSKQTRWDRWTGEIKSSNAPSNISEKLTKKVLEYYDYTDIIEQRKRQKHELVIDHRFPMERWGSLEEKLDINISQDQIKDKFQLLKKDDSGNHNLLKSRACEQCIKTGNRGTPFGIEFWYEGNKKWGENIPVKGKEAEQGCVGCGWYDFQKWRVALNKRLNFD